MNCNLLEGVRIIRISHAAYFLASQLQVQNEDICATGVNLTLVSSPGAELDRLNGLKHTPILIAREISPIKDLISLCRLYLLFRKEKPDIIHSTTPKAGLLCAIAGKLARVPLRFHTFTGQAWATRVGWVRKIGKFSDKVILRLMTRVYADSCSQIEFLQKEGVVNSLGQVKVLGRGSLAGVDLRRFDSTCLVNERKKIREKYQIKESDILILFVGRVTRDKGICELYKAFQELSKNRDDIHLLIVGPLEFDQGLILEGLENRLRNDPNVILAGYQEAPEQFMSASDLMCLPSYREGFGTVVIEAAALGVPTIGTKIQGLVDSIQDGKTGVLVEPKNAEALRNAMLNVANDVKYRTQLGINARKRVIECFDSNAVSHMVLAEYEKYLDRLKKEK